MNTEDRVRNHYGKSDLLDRTKSALQNAGLTQPEAAWADLVPLDQFHIGGLEATKNLAALLSPETGAHLLDVGSGLGGPARFMAATYQASVTGIDLSPEFVETANWLTQFVGLSGHVEFKCADALKLPFEKELFDIAWTQHVAMNIQDRAGLYREIARVLKPGARFAIHDVVAGNQESLLFPVPWAETSETSFLLGPQELESCLDAAGFSLIAKQDLTPAAEMFLQKQIDNRPWERAVGLHVAMGDNFPIMISNLLENVNSGRVQVLQAIYKRR